MAGIASYLFYGFLLDKERDIPVEASWHDDWEAHYARQKGMVRHGHPRLLADGTLNPAWQEEAKEFLDLLSKEPCAIGWYGEEDHIPYVYVQALRYKADVKEPCLVHSTRAYAKASGEIRSFCKVMGIYYREPAWWLASASI